MIFIVILGVIIAIAAILFAFQNSAVVILTLGIWQFEQSLAIVLLITLGLGVIISLLLSIPTIIKRGWQTSRGKKRIQALEAELDARSQEISKVTETLSVIKQNNQELLKAFDLSDSATGLLRQDRILELVNHLLQQVNTNYHSLCIFLLAIEPAKLNQKLTVENQENAVYRAISNRLKNAVNTDSFLGVTNKKRFICLDLGTTKQSATEYGEYLIDALTESPLKKADGTTMPLKVYVGGVIAYPGNIIDKLRIFQQAEQNLEKAKERKRNSIIVTEVTAVVE